MKYFILFGVFFLSACVDPRAPEHAVPKSIISEHVRAFNAGDVEAMAKMQHPNIEWLSVSGTEISVEVAGRDALSKNMAEYFKSPTKVTGKLRDWSVNIPYVSVTETASFRPLKTRLSSPAFRHRLQIREQYSAQSVCAKQVQRYLRTNQKSSPEPRLFQ